MNYQHRFGQIVVTTLFGVLTAFGVVSAAIWNFAPQSIQATENWNDERAISLPYSEVRTQLVRDQFMPRMLEQCGCQILEEQLLERQIDLTSDRRPLLNAILRRSKSSVHQKQLLRLQLPDDSIGATDIRVIQEVSITPERTRIIATLAEPTAMLQDYRFEIEATPQDECVKVLFQGHVTIEHTMSPLFRASLEERVHQGVLKAMNRQVVAFLTSFEQ